MSPLPAEVEPQRRPVHTGPLKVPRFITFAAVLAVSLAVVGYAFGLRLNLSPSIAPGVYRVTEGPIVRGTTVIVCLPQALSAFARSRDFISGGSCPDGNAPIGKTIAGTAGDTVEVTGHGLRVNGRTLPNTRQLTRDHRGRELPRVIQGRYIVAAYEVWLVSTYSERSFDSRYFGAVPTASIVSRVRPIVTVR